MMRGAANWLKLFFKKSQVGAALVVKDRDSPKSGFFK
jgi:hypothetical protein